jgi:hypothetical protein
MRGGRTKRKGGSEADDFFARAKSHVLAPTIVNPDSKFVVVTYWWGRGVLNKNTQRPCPEDATPGQELDVQPIPFEQMIDNWQNACKKHKCNFLAEEYSEFAVKGGYQHAINFKPYFIELALQACAPRGVLYIDGDMRIRLYPGICDTEDIDYMARGWNVDSRPGRWKTQGKKAFCFDPYVFEMSGGTMFFGNTVHGQSLLKFWQKETAKYPGKADDRILTLAIMRNSLLAPLTSIQLPIEYLWLDMDYDMYLDEGDDYDNDEVAISHPECLTGEDRAASEGAATNRYPRGYDRAVGDLMMCDWEEMYEYIHFDSKKHIGPFRPYFDWVDKHEIADIIPFDKKYGSFNPVAKLNEKMMKSIELVTGDATVVVSPHKFGTPSLHQQEDSELLIPTILKYLENGQNVVYIPEKPTTRFILEKVKREGLEFVTRNHNKTKTRSKPAYYLELDLTYPIYFGAKSKTLKHLLRMSDSIKGIQKVFNRSYLFLTRIRCGWL